MSVHTPKTVESEAGYQRHEGRPRCATHVKGTGKISPRPFQALTQYGRFYAPQFGPSQNGRPIPSAPGFTLLIVRTP